MRPRSRLLPSRRAAAIAALSLAGGSFSAYAALVVIAQEAARVERAAKPQQTIVAQFHSPLAAPAAGSTGTTALPALPPGVALAGDGSIQPARPFSLAGASAEARARAQQCLTTAVYYEAASESDEGQRAVAQVVLNRVRHPAFPNSVCGVVYQGAERASGCQFSFACDGALARAPSRSGWARASRIAAAALTGYVMPAVGEATHYHTYAVTPAWNRGLVMTAAIGTHFFHRWQGYWGTPAAFRQSYARVEPIPVPNAVVQVAAVSAPAITKLSTAVEARPKPDAVAVETLPETTMLAKWQGTGQPLK